MKTLSLVTSLALALTSCKRADRDPAPAPTATVAALDLPATVRSPDEQRDALRDPSTPLGGQLARERDNRPTGTPSVATIVTALAAVGFVPREMKQCLGSSLGGAYCAVGSTPEGLMLSITEFDTVEQARAGRDTWNKRFGGGLPGQHQVLRGATLVTMTAEGGNPLVDKAAAAIEALPLD